jgi:Cu/Ag efflux protein CusF/cytochrome c5
VKRARVFLLLAASAVPWAAFAHAPVTTTVQFDREVVRVLDDHCVMCHEEKGPAFPLVTYEQAYAARWKIRQDVMARHMAPWAAVAGYGDFINRNDLTQREIDFLVSWAESYGPRNNGGVYTGIAATASAPKVIEAHFDFDRWVLGKPGAKLALPANTVASGQPATTQRVILDPKLSSDRWLRGLEYKPGDRRVVHAVSFSIEETGQWIGSWTPWYGSVSLPKGLAYKLPARCHIIAEILYRGASAATTDQGSLGLYFTDQSPQRVVTYFALVGRKTLDEDTNILSLQPELSQGIPSVEVAARTPNGTTQVLLYAKDIPVDWPTPYVLRKPVLLPKGTELTAGTPVLLSAYQGAPLPSDEPRMQSSPAVPPRRFKLTGTVKSVDTADARIVVQHDAIPGLMDAMTMSYGVGEHEHLKDVKAGDAIQSDVVVSDSGTHLENIEVTGHAR